jgi:hypothetical protein
VVECFPSIHEFLGSIPSTEKEKKKLRFMFFEGADHLIEKIAL